MHFMTFRFFTTRFSDVSINYFIQWSPNPSKEKGIAGKKRGEKRGWWEGGGGCWSRPRGLGPGGPSQVPVLVFQC